MGYQTTPSNAISYVQYDKVKKRTEGEGRGERGEGRGERGEGRGERGEGRGERGEGRGETGEGRERGERAKRVESEPRAR